MSAALYEIVLLPDGDFALQRTDDPEEPLVRISFSAEAKSYLGATGIDVAKAMIDAGIDALEELSAEAEAELAESGDNLEERFSERVLH
jgi:hypothetical protein